MELQGTVLTVGAIEEKGTAKFLVAKIMLDRKSINQGQEYPNFTEVTFQGKKTEILKTANLGEGDYIKVNGDLQGRYFQYEGSERFAQDFVAWNLEVVRKAQTTLEPEKTADNGIHN
ncbi:hypothetical protein [Chryseobacterium sp. MP_3.2]|uniref:hypothetical protein n=1 Tax=Chryseobacterium sp. MP_3.2 TaxID=3071712 RepID=UPI002E0473E5|nr:hypothetical protein [Chryseobacterium sp. MP_3.2]